MKYKLLKMLLASFVVLAFVQCDNGEERAYKNAVKKNSIGMLQNFIDKYPDSKYIVDAKNKLQDIKDYNEYIDNSLYNGAQPYSTWYGYNKLCNSYGCSAITVRTPNSDVLVMIKNGNEQVVRHAYIAANSSYTFELPDGNYETFFYYGRGWNPNKKMGNGVLGGFITDEVFSKSGYEYLSNQELSYTLQLVQNGNFRTKGSSQNEMF